MFDLYANTELEKCDLYVHFVAIPVQWYTKNMQYSLWGM